MALLLGFYVWLVLKTCDNTQSLLLFFFIWWWANQRGPLPLKHTHTHTHKSLWDRCNQPSKIRVVFPWGQFCDVSKVRMIRREKRFSQIWLQATFQSKILETSFLVCFFCYIGTWTIYRNLTNFLKFGRLLAFENL
jgi:hypothetical protein